MQTVVLGQSARRAVEVLPPAGPTGWDGVLIHLLWPHARTEVLVWRAATALREGRAAAWV